MKKNLIWITILLIISICTSCTKNIEENKNDDTQQKIENQSQIQQQTAPIQEQQTEFTEKKIGDDLPISRALVAKMITLAFNNKWEIASMDNEISFTDVKEEDWYYEYINAAVAQGYMSGTGKQFLPLEPLNIEQAQILIDKINSKNKTKIKMTEETKTKPISYSLWGELFEKALKERTGKEDIFSDYGIEEKQIIVFATPNNYELSSWTMATDKGMIGFAGFSVDGYIDEKVKVLLKENEIISIRSILENAPIITGAYIRIKPDNKIETFISDTSREFYCANVNSLEQGNYIADIQVKNGQILQIIPLTENKTGTIKKVEEKQIELAESGKNELTEDIKIYEETENGVNWKSTKNLICGTNIADYYLKDGKIAAAVVRRKASPEKIRIVLSSSDFSSYVHENVLLSSSTGMIISSQDFKKEIPSDWELKISLDENTELFENGRITISPVGENGKLQLKSVLKNDVVPQYRGIFEIEKKEDGFVIVNEVDLEQYLYAVIPSEMPSSYGEEAAKVQAVTARSYAYNQFYANKFCQYGANVDDSTTCQVYNTVEENETSMKAVNATKGLCITYQGAVISANFFSTSAGYTANSGEVWANNTNKKFPGFTEEYLKATPQYMTGDFGDLSQEENAAKFLKEKNIDSFDNWTGWFRWQTSMTAQQLTATINHNIKEAYENSKALVKTQQPDGTYKSRPIETVGEVLDISVKKRGQGGNVMELLIKGSKAQVIVSTEYNVRKVLQPVNYIAGADNVILSCMDGTQKINYKLLPSGFFTFDLEKETRGAIKFITIYGGGNGHGVGLSQNGTKGMVDKGMKYDEILKHYYKGVELEKKI